MKIGDKLTRSEATARLSFAVAATTARNATALEAGEYLVTTSTACFIAQGDDTVEASATAASAFLPAGGSLFIAVDDETSAHVAAIRSTADGRIFFQKLAPVLR
jgi:hypothetical protein